VSPSRIVTSLGSVHASCGVLRPTVGAYSAGPSLPFPERESSLNEKTDPIERPGEPSLGPPRPRDLLRMILPRPI
jgi:hypothetical protein